MKACAPLHGSRSIGRLSLVLAILAGCTGKNPIDMDTDGADDTAAAASDADNDGHDALAAGGDDCDDMDATVNPGAGEVAYDGIDQDCSGADLTDVDGDGHDALTAGGDDCDDTNAAVSPAAIETCNTIDDDCDGAIDEAGATGETTWYEDGDGDGHGAAASMQACSAPEGYVALGDDCDDRSAAAHPGLVDLPYDGIDQDCSGADLTDVDGDGYAAQLVGGEDCDDTSAAVSPAAIEACNTIDDDCDGAIDEAGSTGETAWYQDEDGDGHGSAPMDACSAPEGYVAAGDDCNDASPTIHPGAVEVPYDGVDQDCSGADLSDVDGDGYVAQVVGGDDCDDDDPTLHPGAAEIAYDGVDQDCSGADLTDVDGDGYDATMSGGDDCRDTDTASHPGAAETPNDGIDQDCSGYDFIDLDGDGYAAASVDGDDCDDGDAAVHPGASDIEANATDEDCDDLVDEAEVCPDGSRTYATIQEAVDLGETLIQLCPGTYVENVVTDHSLDVEGSLEDPDSVVLQAADPLQFAVNATGGDLVVRGVSLDAGLAVWFDHATSVDLDTDRFCPSTGVMTVLQGLLNDATGVVSLEDSYVCYWHSPDAPPDDYAGMVTISMVPDAPPSYVGGTVYIARNVFDDGLDGGSSWMSFMNYGSNNYYSNNLIIDGGLIHYQEPGTFSTWTNNTIVNAGIDFNTSKYTPTGSAGTAQFADNIFYQTFSRGVFGGDVPETIGQWSADYSDYSWEPLSTCGTVQPRWSSGLLFTTDPYVSTLYERVCDDIYCEDAYWVDYDCSATSVIVTSSILSDPYFASDPERGSYALDPASPAIDAGVGGRDPDSTPNDMGAFGGPDGNWYQEVPWLIP